MKAALLYFTGTGVTAKYASELGKQFENLHVSVDLLRIKRGKKIDFSIYDIIGIGAPAYSIRAPRMVTRFLRKAKLEKKPLFVFCTSGGMPGNTLWNLFKATKRTGGICLGYTSAIGSTNLRSWMPPKNELKSNLSGLNNYDLSNAQKFAKTIITRFENLSSNLMQQNKNWIPSYSIGIVFWSLFFTWSWQMLFTVGIKRVDKSKCNHCRLCASKICSSGAISMNKNNTPSFNELLCVGCNGCVNLCPQDAIWTFQTRNHQQYDLYETYL